MAANIRHSPPQGTRNNVHKPARWVHVLSALVTWLALSAPSALAQYQWTNFAGMPGGDGNVDGTGSSARFSNPMGVAVDTSGNAYVADHDNNTLRKITFGGVVTTLAGLASSSGSTDGTGSAARFLNPFGVAVDASGNVYVTDQGNHTLRKVTPSGVVTTLAGLAGSTGSSDGTGSAARFNSPSGVAVDASGNVYIADQNNHTIRKVTSGGVVSTLAGLAGSSGSGNGTGSAARFSSPRGVTVDSSGNVFVADTANNILRKVTSGGVVTTLAGSSSSSSSGSSDGTGSAARFFAPIGVTVDASGNLYVADTANNILRKVTSGGVVSTLAGLAGLAGSSGSSDGTGGAAQFSSPYGVSVDGSGSIYVADLGNNLIRKVTSAGVVSTFAGSRSNQGSSDGLGSTARFYNPLGVAVDASGNVYVADLSNHTIRKVTSAGVVSTLAGLAGSSGSSGGTGSAARFNSPQSVAVDASGNVYVADTGNHTIRKVTSAGVVTTLAGSAGNTGSSDGTGIAARFYNPNGVAVDTNGNVYVSDRSNSTIRKVTSGGVVSTIGGTAGVIDGKDGAGSAASFSSPRGISVSNAGTIFVADGDNNRISLGTLGLVANDMAVQQPAGTNISPGGTQSFGVLVQGGTASLTFTITNPGTQDLTGLTISKDGANAADFSITASPTAPVSFGGSTTFTITFTPAAGGAQTLFETAAIHIASNVAGKNPFDINLTGTALSYTQSTSNDGMSDAAKFLLAPLGFNWQASQPALVNTYYSNANAANLYTQAQYNTSRTAGQNDVTAAPNTYSLYTLSQVQTLNVGTPLLTKSPGTGQFKLTIGVQQTPTLSQPFTAFPMSAPNTSINAQGQLEFLFTVPDNAAFFRVQAK